MTLNTNEINVVQLLVKRKKFVTAGDISRSLGISAKTVYRAVTAINKKSLSGPLIESRRGIGFQINYERYISASKNKNESAVDTNPKKRRINVMLELLFKAPKKVSIDELFSPYYLSESAVINDINALAKWSENEKVRLSKTRKYLSVEGNERSIRELINKLLSNFDTFYSDEFIDGSGPGSHGQNYDVKFLVEQLKYLEKLINSAIPYPYNVNIFSHLFILVKRFREIGDIKSREIDISKADKLNIVKGRPELFQAAERVIHRTSQYLNYPLPEQEIFYLSLYLLSSRIDSKAAVTPMKQSDEEIRVIDFFIDNVSQVIRLAADREVIRSDLYNHFHPMLIRIKQHIFVKNVLLNEIKEEYAALFKTISDLAQRAQDEFGLEEINANEIGYITLYFAKYVEQEQYNKKIIIMCTSGIGTSELLKVKIKKYFPGVKIVAVVSVLDYSDDCLQYSDADFIVSTVKIPIKTTKPCILVSALFTDKDRERVESLMKRV